VEWGKRPAVCELHYRCRRFLHVSLARCERARGPCANPGHQLRNPILPCPPWWATTVFPPRRPCGGCCLHTLSWALQRWPPLQSSIVGKASARRGGNIPAMVTFTTTFSDGSNSFVNNRCDRLYRAVCVEQSSGAGWQRAIHPYDLVAPFREVALAIAYPGIFFEETKRAFLAPTTGTTLVSGACVPLRDQNGTLLGWYGTTHRQSQIATRARKPWGSVGGDFCVERRQA